MENQKSNNSFTKLILLISLGLFIVGCSESMNPPNSSDEEVCHPEYQASERESCMVAGGDGLKIERTEDLAPLCSSSCDSLAGIGFWKVSGLKDLTVLQGLSNIISGIGVHRNPDLETLSGLENITIEKSIGLYENPKLRSLGEISADELVRLTVMGNKSLENLKGLENITSIGMRAEPKASSPLGSLEIRESHGLKSLEGLENVETLYELTIFDNHNLERIDALSKVTYMDGPLSITDNPSLTSIESLMNIEKIDHSVRIEYNPSLPACQVQKFLDNVEISEHYTVTVGNNGTGNCES